MTDLTLSPDQQEAIDRLYEHNATILVAATGAGKSVICLTAIKDMIDNGHLKQAIIACPAKLVEQHTHRKEVDKWAHLEGLRVFEVVGAPDRREKIVKNPAAQVLVVSLNNLDWLLDQPHGCDGIVIDELSKAAGKQTAALRKRKGNREIVWRVGMTATPVSQSFEKLYDMARIIDHGAALGTNRQQFLETYFFSDYNGYNWTLRDGAAAQITERVRGLVHLVEDRKKDTLPPIEHRQIRFDMPASTREVYDAMKKELVAELGGGAEVEAANEAVKTGKLRQIASGFLYDENGKRPISGMLDCARERVFQRFLLDHPGKLVIFYEYSAQGEDIHQLYGGTTDVDKFMNNPDARRLIAQFNSLGHGVDGLQDVCSDVVFYHPLWSRDSTEQCIGRIWRQGQAKPVTVTTLVCNDTLDDVVMERVAGNARWMELMTAHLTGKGEKT
jgi:superfamily II DNA or RNA helicase